MSFRGFLLKAGLSTKGGYISLDNGLGLNAYDAQVLNTARIATGASGGSALTLDANFTWTEALELRYNVTSWTGIGNNCFKGMYVRPQINTANASGSIRGVEINTCNNGVALGQMEGLYLETQVKAIAANASVGPIYGIESQISLYAPTSGTLTLNEDTNVGVAAGRFQLGLNSGLADYTSVYGILIQSNDGSVGTRTLGSAICVRNYPVEGTQTWTVGLDLQAACINAIKFGQYTPTSDGSNGSALLRAGTYTSPLTESTAYQGGIFRMYLETSGTSSYNKGAFICLKTTGAKGIHGVCSLMEVLAQAAAGPTSVHAGQFIAHLNSATAKIASGGLGLPEFVGIWAKITANEGATIAASTISCPLWIDNQLYGAGVSGGEEYGIFATTGGSKPDAFIGFQTTSAGWSNLFSFDETSYDQDPVGSATISGGTQDKYLKVDINGTAYGIALYAI